MQKNNLIGHFINSILETGALVIGITFDGAAANISTVNLLGCDIKDISTPNILKLVNLENTFTVLLDPCHMLKLFRNAFGDLKTFIDSDK